MIDVLDKLLRQLFVTRVPTLTDPAQVRFRPPDQDWRAYVVNLQNLALDVYLVELRENRRLRTNESLRDVQNGLVTDTPAPRWTDCHYLITAWSPADDSLEPALLEHALLYQVTAALMDAEPLVPRDVYGNQLPLNFPPLLADAELPSMVLPVEGFPKYAEFWGTMGNVHPWKPAVYLVVTLPVALSGDIVGLPVTTAVASYQQANGTGPAEVLIQIAGTVSTAAGPLTGAWVRLETPGQVPVQLATTDELGHFTFTGLQPGAYQLRTRAAGLEKVRAVSVPSGTGEYDVQLP